jgi:phospholipid/cholesterol/gamma-HCH transport system substrate-binding protein
LNPTASQLRWTGIFLVSGSILTIFATAILLGTRLSRSTLPLVCSLRGESVSGLSNGSKVLLRGIQVGSVTSLGFDSSDPERILVGIEIDPKAPVYQNATATLEIFGITGLRYMELIPGDPERGKAQPNSVIAIRPSFTSTILKSIDTVARTSASVLANLDSLTRPDRVRQIDSIMLDLRSTSRDFAAMSRDLRAARIDQKLSILGEQAGNAVRRIDSTVAEIKPARSIARLDSATIAVSNLARRADLMLSRSQGNYYHAMEDLGTTLRNLSDFSLTIRNNPATLLRSGERDNP